MEWLGNFDLLVQLHLAQNICASTTVPASLHGPLSPSPVYTKVKNYGRFQTGSAHQSHKGRGGAKCRKFNAQSSVPKWRYTTFEAPVPADSGSIAWEGRRGDRGSSAGTDTYIAAEVRRDASRVQES